MITKGGWREVLPRTRERDRDRRRQRRWAPEVSALEGRALQTVVVVKSSLAVVPQILPPTASGRPIPVTVSGLILETRPDETPTGFFHVTDEYRRYEPHGTLALIPAGKYFTTSYHQFAFRLNLRLPTNRSTNTLDGRHYDILVGATGKDNTDGQTVEALVPKTFPPPQHPRPRAASTRKAGP
jgi:hypothetical protein